MHEDRPSSLADGEIVGGRVPRWPRFALPLAAFAAAAWIFVRAGGRAGDWALLLAVVLPALGLLGGWLVREGLHWLEDRRALASFARGEPQKEGSWAAAAGIARARDLPLVAPLSDRPALACTYRVTEKVRGAPAQAGRARAQFVQRRYSGWHLVPTLIETERGSYELRGFPDLMDLEMSSLGASNVGRLEHRASPPPGRAKDAARAGLLVRPGAELHLDWKLGDAAEGGRIEVKEWLLSPDEPVCLCGIFGDGALLPHRSRPRGMPLYPGTASEVLERLAGESRIYLLAGSTCLLAATFLAVWFLR